MTIWVLLFGMLILNESGTRDPQAGIAGVFATEKECVAFKAEQDKAALALIAKGEVHPNVMSWGSQCRPLVLNRGVQPKKTGTS